MPRSLRSFSLEVIATTIRTRSIFDETATEEDKELLSVAGTEIIADYPDNFTIEEEFLIVTSDKKTDNLDELIYLRYERS